MKKRTFTLAGLSLMMIMAASVVFAQKESEEKEYHIVLEKIRDGHKARLDTVVRSDEPFVWQGDTIRPGNGGMAHQFKFKTDDDGNVNVYVMKEAMAELDSLQENLNKIIDENIMIFKGDMDDDVFEWHGDDNHVWNFHHDFPHRHGKVMVIEKETENRNVIDLSDPDIISYRKKEMKDGTEKITIVRKKGSKKEKSEEIIIKNSNSSAMTGRPEMDNEVVVIDEDGKVKLNGEVVEYSDENGVKIIKKDGKTILIRTTGDGDEKKVDVEVEENHEDR